MKKCFSVAMVAVAFFCAAVISSGCEKQDDRYYVDNLGIDQFTTTHTLIDGVLSVTVSTIYVVKDVKMRAVFFDANNQLKLGYTNYSGTSPKSFPWKFAVLDSELKANNVTYYKIIVESGKIAVSKEHYQVVPQKLESDKINIY